MYEKRYSPYNVFQLTSLATRIIECYGITTPCIEDAYRIEEDLRAKNIKTSTIKHYLRVLELLGEYKGLPLKIHKPKTIYAIPKALNTTECKSLITACDNLRDQAIVSILIYCGLRSKELCDLKIDDIDLKNRFIYVRDHGKGIKNRHERKVIMSHDCAKNVKLWTEVRPTLDDNDSLFFTVNGEKLTGLRLNRIIKSIARKAGLSENVYTHLLRHTCATNMLRSGIPITEVALQLGHRSLSSTMVYLHADVEGLKESIDKKFVY